jgi:hypothetical protein
MRDFKGANMTTLVGKKIIAMRPMTQQEMDQEGWESKFQGVPVVLILESGVKLYSSCDEEGNGPGAMFGMTPDGKSFSIYSE